MPDIATATYTRLTADPAVSAVVGDRVYPILRPQNSPLPAIRIQYPSNIPERHLKGEEGVQLARLQLDCFAFTSPASMQLAQKAKDAMLDPATVGGVIFGAAAAEGPIPEPGSDSPSGYIYWTRVDLLVRYRLA